MIEYVTFFKARRGMAECDVCLCLVRRRSMEGHARWHRLKDETSDKAHSHYESFKHVRMTDDLVVVDPRWSKDDGGW